MYAPWRLESTVARSNPAWMKARKTTDGGGEDYRYFVEYAIPGRSATFRNAQLNAGRVRHAQFAMTFADDVAVVQIAEKLLEGSNTDAKAIRNTMKAQTDGILTALRNSAGRHMYGNGSGQLGTVSAATNLGTTTMGLATVEDMNNFHEGQVLEWAASDAAALRTPSTADISVTAIDEIAGTMTLSAIPSVAAGPAPLPQTGDAIFTQGDYLAAGDRLNFIGLDGWIPTQAAFAINPTIFTFNRNVNRTALAGYAFDDATTYAGFNEDDAIQLLAEYISRGGGTMDCAFLNPFRIRRLINQVGSSERFNKKVGYEMKRKVMATLGYTGVYVATPAGVVECIADRNCPVNTTFAGDGDKLDIVSIGTCPHWVGPMAKDGRPMEASLAREFRLAAWPQMGIRRPRSWGRFDWT
jgi:hypothetical protein